jgi:hypothetical protein
MYLDTCNMHVAVLFLRAAKAFDVYNVNCMYAFIHIRTYVCVKCIIWFYEIYRCVNISTNIRKFAAVLPSWHIVTPDSFFAYESAHMHKTTLRAIIRKFSTLCPNCAGNLQLYALVARDKYANQWSGTDTIIHTSGCSTTYACNNLQLYAFIARDKYANISSDILTHTTYTCNRLQLYALMVRNEYPDQWSEAVTTLLQALNLGQVLILNASSRSKHSLDLFLHNFPHTTMFWCINLGCICIFRAFSELRFT